MKEAKDGELWIVKPRARGEVGHQCTLKSNANQIPSYSLVHLCCCCFACFGVWLFAYLKTIGQIELVIRLSYVLFLGIIGSLMAWESTKAILKSNLRFLAKSGVIISKFVIS